ncbi:Uncharacterised protein [Serratia liquefaciens]|nr:Uncharacterised protein [Serratia liquefaciens]
MKVWTCGVIVGVLGVMCISRVCTADMSVIGGWQQPPLPYITVSASGTVRDIGYQGTWPTCEILVYVYADEWSGPGRPSEHYRLRGDGRDGVTPTCFGYPVYGSEGLSPQQYAQRVVDSIKSVAVPWAARGGNPGPTAPGLRNVCYYRILVNSGNRWWSVADSPESGKCNVVTAPKPVSCVLGAPALLTHPNKEAGRVHGRLVERVTVQCDSPSTVSLSVPRRDLTLSSVDEDLASSLYLGGDGSYSVKLHADPTAVTNIISIIDSPVSTPGVYTGSAVLTATWE